MVLSSGFFSKTAFGSTDHDNQRTAAAAPWASHPLLPVFIMMLVPSLLPHPQCPLAGASFFIVSCPGRLPAAQTAALVQRNSDAQIRISSQAIGWGKGKKRRTSGLAATCQTTAHSPPAKASLQRHHQYFLGRQRHSTWDGVFVRSDMPSRYGL